jgi:hypothetical protein
MKKNYGTVTVVARQDGEYVYGEYEINGRKHTKEIKLREDGSNKDTALAVVNAWRAEIIAASFSKRGAVNRPDVREILSSVKERVAERKRQREEDSKQHQEKIMTDIEHVINRYGRSAMDQSYENVFGGRA